MKVTLFLRDKSSPLDWPKFELAHITAMLTGQHYCYSGDEEHRENFELGLHGFTAEHARQLIDVLTPIAAEEKA